jgi:myo-inositol-1(or 4)-monophosphatase
MSMHPHSETLSHIANALSRANEVLQEFVSGKIEVFQKSGGDPVTAADHAVNDLLRKILPRDGEGWLSEETTDDLSRLETQRVWVVDPLDGTKEFVAGIPEWCVSIAFVEAGRAVAGGILNPQTDERFLGATGFGVTYNGKPAKLRVRNSLDGALVLASRSEVNRGEWDRFMGAAYTVQAMGSVAYKLARVSAGLADATWTLVPKHEWDIAAGAALVLAAGGAVYSPDGSPVSFNNRNPKLTGLVAHSPSLIDAVRSEIRRAGFNTKRKRG